MADKTTTIRLTDDDQECVASLSKRTGIRSTTEVLCYSLRVALGGDAHPPSSAPSLGVEELDAALVAIREALHLWTPSNFEGARAKASAEDALAKALRHAKAVVS